MTNQTEHPIPDKLPPVNLEAEQSVLGSMMLSKDALKTAVETLVAEKLYKPQDRMLFDALKELGREGLPGDLVLVADKLNDKGVLDAVGGRAYIHQLVDTTPNPHNISYYCEIVLDTARRREVIDASYRMITAAQKGEDFDLYLDALHESRPEELERPRLETVTAYDLQGMTFPPATFIVQNLLPAGLCFFAGAYKSGKSWMVLGLGLAVALGDTFFDEPTTQGEVLFVGVEDNERRLHRRLDSICKAGWPDTLHIATRMPRLDDGGIEALENFVDEHPDTRLVILDVWARVRGRERSRNMYSDDYRALEGVQSFASDRDVAVVVVHHHRKAPDEKDPFNKFSGSTGIGGGADALWSLERERGQCNASFITTGRDIHEVELALDFNELTGEWTALGPLGEYTTSLERSQVMQVLRDAEGSSVSPKEVAEALDKNVSTVQNLLKKMLEAGEIEKAGYGAYAMKENVTFVDFQKDN